MKSIRRELETLATASSLASWPTEVLRPSPSLWDRVAKKIGDGEHRRLEGPSATSWEEPAWESPAPGIWCKLLSTDVERNRVSMLVRLEPGVAYPPHTHAGVEELHLLQGELWIDDRKLFPGEYNYGKQGASDQRVWTETGCTCVLITSPSDELR
jgi:hypothetical protein